MKQSIVILAINDFVEDVLTIKVEDNILDVFSFNMPTNLLLQTNYFVEFEAQIFNEYDVSKTTDEPCLRQVGNSLSYEIIGMLNNGVVNVNGLLIYDEILLSDYAYLDGEIIKWYIDRIDVFF